MGQKGIYTFLLVHNNHLTLIFEKGTFVIEDRALNCLQRIFSGAVLLLLRYPQLHFENVDISFDPLHPKKGEGFESFNINVSFVCGSSLKLRSLAILIRDTK